MEHAVASEVHPGCALHQFSLDGSKIQLGVGSAIGEHGPRLCLHHNHDGSRRTNLICNQVGCHAGFLKLLRKSLHVTRTDSTNKVDLDPRRGKPHGGIRSRSARTLHNAGRGVGVVSQGHRDGGEDVIDDIAYDQDSRLFHCRADQAVAISTATAMLLLTKSRFTPKLAPFECSTM